MAEDPLPPETPAAQPASAFAQVNWSCVDAIFEEQSRSLAALAKAAGASPETFFAERNFRGISLKNIDIRGVSLENANLVGTGVRFAVIDGTTKLDGAKLDAVDRSALWRKGLLPVARRGTPYAGKSFDQIMVRQHKHYIRGRDKRNNADLEIAIALARIAVTRASNATFCWSAYNELGNALMTLGTREGGPARLREAIVAYNTALEKLTGVTEPLLWAMTQSNLGLTLQALGTLESDLALLRQAVDAFRAVLEERTRENAPLEWAAAQNNFGAALFKLGELESDPAPLRQAVDAFRAAMEERTRERVPLEWAATQYNLGAALSKLGELETDPTLLMDFVEVYRAARDGRTRERGTQMIDPAPFRQAVDAYREALKEYTRERVPYGWAQTRESMAIAFLATYRLTSEEADRAQALEAVEDALAVHRDANAVHNIAKAEALRAQILAAAPAH